MVGGSGVGDWSGAAQGGCGFAGGWDGRLLVGIGWELTEEKTLPELQQFELGELLFSLQVGP